ncbi:hypothetical protein TPA0910_03550 [Streptomyces hygroscopicus subsp. sporocinereus]|uniref:Uncharacterized protein n=1 Tax=Streptomyces hygroscopicus TaxID=1912 RepID=A0ABQ3TRG8_STRHY|nr:hypothetical protein TPA0910_03550 [Streptomyces hygroscopicus]
MDGVSTYLALTFGTLLSSQGTDASFETVSPVSPGASLRCFTRYQTVSRSPNRCLSQGMRKRVRDLDQVTDGAALILDVRAAVRSASSGGQGYDSTADRAAVANRFRAQAFSPACAACTESEVPMTYSSGQCAVRDRR